MSRLNAVPINLKAANNFVALHHRHNKPVVGARFSIGCATDDDLIGVAIVGRPVCRHLDDGFSAEVVRCCVVNDSQKGTCSFLYAACWRAWKAMGGTKLITYTLQSETGASLRGAGWSVVHENTGFTGKGWQSRIERQNQEITGQAKFRWEVQ